jgi:hypothetical protein
VIVQDENALRFVEVDKVYSDKREVFFAFRAEATDEEVAVLLRAFAEKGMNVPTQIEGGSIEVAVRCEPPADVSGAECVLQALLESLGSTASSSFRIHFEARPDVEASRGRFEAILNDPNASDFRKEVATRALAALDRRLEEKKRT